MAITQPALAHAVARDLLRAAPPEAGIKRLWVWSEHGYVDPERDYVELTILYAPAEDGLQDYLGEAIDGLHERYPDVNILAHTISSHDLDGFDPDGEVRPESDEIVLAGE